MKFNITVHAQKYISAEVDANDLESAKQMLKENLYQQGFRLISFVDIEDVEYNSKEVQNEMSKVQEEKPDDTSA